MNGAIEITEYSETRHERWLRRWLAVLGLLACAMTASAQPLAPGWHDDQSIDAGDRTRYYRYYVPETLAAEPPAAVFFLHGGTGSMRSTMPPSNNPSAEWPAVAERNGFILVVPNGVNRDTGDAFGDDQNWNDCRENAPDDFVGEDVAFLDALMDWSVDTLGVDATRIHFTGSSNGGMMSYRMATERPERIASVAAFIANQPEGDECPAPDRGLPMLLAHGTEDPLVPYGGGTVSGAVGGRVRSAPDTVQTWREAAGITAAPRIEMLPDLDPEDGSQIEARHWRDPASGFEIRWLRMLGAGHAMPSIARPVSVIAEGLLGPHNHDLEGAEAAWAFVSRFRSFPAVSDGQWVHASPAFGGNAQGLTLDYLPSAGVLFVAWFTYTDQPMLPPETDDGSLGATDQRWLTAQLEVSGNRAEGPVFNSTGGRFDSVPTGFETSEPVGSMQIEFSACNRAVVTYSLDGPPLARAFEIQPLEQLAVETFTCSTARQY